MPAAGNVPFKLLVDESACHACRRCLGAEVCRGSAFRILDPGDSPFIDMSRCWGCLVCIPACPFHAIIKRSYSIE